MDEPDELRQREINKSANELVERFGCSYSVAHKSVTRYWPTVRMSVEKMSRRRRPCIVALEFFALQRDYIDTLRTAMLPLEGTLLPCFRPEELHKRSNGCTELTWAEVAHHVNNGPGIEIFFSNGKRGIAPSVSAYESFYQKIIEEGVTNVVGFITAVDGMVPLLDYLHVRHFGGASPLPSLPSNFVDASSEVEIHQHLLQAPRHQNAVHRTRILFGNSVETSISHRQNKASMQMALKAKGLAHIHGISAHGSLEAQEKMLSAGIFFPVIVKPVSGAGSEFVTLCYDAEDVDAAFAICQNVKTMQQTEASHMVLQEYIEGAEYVVNTVSYQGRHVVSDVWKSWKFPVDLYSTRLRQSVEEEMKLEYHRTRIEQPPKRVHTTALLYDRVEFVHDLADHAASDEERRVVDYTLRCLDALGVRQGCSHCEVRIDERPGSARRGSPVLIELNARMLGDTPRATELVGYDQYMLTTYLALCAAALPEDKFGTDSDSRARLPWPPAPLLYRSLVSCVTRHVVFLRAVEESCVCVKGVRGIKALPTFKFLTRDTIFDEPKKQSRPLYVCMTTDLLTSPGACVMEGTEADIRRDTAYIRRVENKDLSEWESLIDAACEFETTLADAATTTTTSTSIVQGERVKFNTMDEQVSKEYVRREATQHEVESYFFSMQEPPLFVPSTLVMKLRKIGIQCLITDRN